MIVKVVIITTIPILIVAIIITIICYHKYDYMALYYEGRPAGESAGSASPSRPLGQRFDRGPAPCYIYIYI